MYLVDYFSPFYAHSSWMINTLWKCCKNKILFYFNTSLRNPFLWLSPLLWFLSQEILVGPKTYFQWHYVLYFSLQYLPCVPSTSFPCQEILFGPKTYFQIICTIMFYISVPSTCPMSRHSILRQEIHVGPKTYFQIIDTMFCIPVSRTCPMSRHSHSYVKNPCWTKDVLPDHLHYDVLYFSLQYLPYVPSLSFLRQEIHVGPKTYFQIIDTMFYISVSSTCPMSRHFRSSVKKSTLDQRHTSRSLTLFSIFQSPVPALSCHSHSSIKKSSSDQRRTCRSFALCSIFQSPEPALCPVTLIPPSRNPRRTKDILPDCWHYVTSPENVIADREEARYL